MTGRDKNILAKQAVTITDPSELAGAMTDQLVELFDEKNSGLASPAHAH